MLYFRSDFSNKFAFLRIYIWLFVFLVFTAGYLFSDFQLIHFHPKAFIIVAFLIVITFLPSYFVKKNSRVNFYYLILLSFLDPILISLLLFFSKSYHHVFIFLFVCSLFYSGFIFNKLGSVFITFWNAIVFIVSVGFAKHEVSASFQVAVVLLFFVFTLSVITIKDYFKNIIRHMRIKDKNISALEFFNVFLMNNMENGLLLVNELGRITFSNKASGSLLGVDNKKILNKNIKDVFEVFSTFCNESGTKGRREEVWEELDGKRTCISFKVSPIVMENEYAGNIVVLEDITQYKIDQRRQMQNEKLAAIGRLAAALAHEIRNPLASISGSVEMIKESFIESQEHQKLMTIILREIDGLNILINELLDFVKPIKLSKNKIDIGSLLKETTDLISFESKIPININLTKGLEYNGDPNKLKQVFLNILKNSIEVLPASKGQIQVRTFQDKAGKIIIEFEDNGPGILKENYEKIFEPFYTTKEKGTGLGLPTCYNILVLHGGEIKVASQPGKTVFKIIL